MAGNEDPSSILRGAGDAIFALVCDRSTPQQWVEWLRAPLAHAVGTGSYELVQKLLRAGADGSAGRRVGSGQTLLHDAAQGGNGQVVTALMRAGGARGDMNAKTIIGGHTPLHLAVFGGKEAAAKAMILAGADVNIRNDNNDAPLPLAIEGGHAGIVENLLIGGANHAERGSSGDYPIHLAARRGNGDVVLALVQKGVDVNCRDARGRPPLAVAVIENHVSAVKALLAGGVDDVDYRMGNARSTPLHVAAASGNKAASIITALVEGGADIEARNRAGKTPLYISACFGSRASVLALLRLGADANTRLGHGLTPLHGVCRAGNLAVADLLLRWGADETAVNKYGKTARQEIPYAQASEQHRPTLERLAKLLARAPQDRAWRRRGFIVMCRAHRHRFRLAVEIPETARPSRRARRVEVKVEIQVGRACAMQGGGGAGSSRSIGGGSSSDVFSSRRAGGEGVGGGFDGLAAWLMAVTEETVFRNIVGFL